MVWLPMHIIPPLVLLAVTMHPAQSESVYPVIIDVDCCQGKCATNLGRPARYLPIFFSPPKCEALGVDMCRADSFVAY